MQTRLAVDERDDHVVLLRLKTLFSYRIERFGFGPRYYFLLLTLVSRSGELLVSVKRDVAHNDVSPCRVLQDNSIDCLRTA